MSRSKRVLVIEPSPTVRLLLELHLKRAGHQVIMYPSVEMLVRDVPRFQQMPPEVVFLAVDTLTTKWREEVQQVRQWWGVPVLLVVLLSCRETERTEVQRTLNALPALYVHKPFHLQFVVALVFALHATSSSSATPSIQGGQ